MKKLVVIAMVLGLVGIGFAADSLWNGGTGDWATVTNWTPQVLPKASTVAAEQVGAFIDADGSIVNVTGTGNSAHRMFTQGTAGASGTATINVSGQLSVSGAYAALGKAGGTGIMNVSSTGNFYSKGLSVGDVGTGILNVYGTVKVGSGSESWLKFGIAGAWANANSTGTVNLYAGTLDLSGAQEIRMATASGTTATLNIAGGSLIMPGTITDLRGAILTLNAAGVHLQAYGVEYAGDTMFAGTRGTTCDPVGGCGVRDKVGL
jgi:hypothetical protein